VPRAGESTPLIRQRFLIACGASSSLAVRVRSHVGRWRLRSGVPSSRRSGARVSARRDPGPCDTDPPAWVDRPM